MELLQKVTQYVVVLDEAEYEKVIKLFKDYSVQVEEPTNTKRSNRKRSTKQMYEMYAKVNSDENLKILSNLVHDLCPEHNNDIKIQANNFPVELYLGLFTSTECSDLFRAVRSEIAELTHREHQ